PLALYIFTDSKNIIKRILKETSSGGVCINDTLVHLSCAGLPFGGVGDSGMGQYHGRNTFETFVHRKGVLQRGMFPDLRLRYPPYDGKMMFIRGAYRWLMD
ncbi:MAG: aldehyde dehydrogenase family protein, partial [Thermoplasmata archaeon]